MIGPIETFMTADHVRLDALLDRADRTTPIDHEAFETFRSGMLRHVAMEEKVLLPLARERRGGEPLPLARKLRLDHGEIAKLLVPTPTPELCERLRAKLAEHNPLEEGEQGLYAQCDRLAGADAAGVVDRLRAMPEVPLAKHYDGPLLRDR